MQVLFGALQFCGLRCGLCVPKSNQPVDGTQGDWLKPGLVSREQERGEPTSNQDVSHRAMIATG